MIIDKFVMKWKLDTADASKSLKDIQKESSQAAKQIQEDSKDAVKSINESARESAESAASASKQATEKAAAAAKQAAEKAKKDAEEAKKPAKLPRAAPADKKPPSTRRPPTPRTAPGEEGAPDWSKLSKTIHQLIRAGEMGGRLGSFGWHSLRIFPGMGSLMKFGVGLMSATATVAAFTKSIQTANDRAERALKIREEAWGTARSITGFNQQVLKGKSLGMTEAETRDSLTAFANRLREAIVNPYGEAAFRYRQYGIQTGTHRQPRDVEAILRDVIGRARGMAATTGGPNEGIAFLTQRMGMSFTMARRLMEATDEQLKEYNSDMKEQARHLTVSQALAEKYAIAQRNLDFAVEKAGTEVATAITPALRDFTKQLEESAEKTDGLVAVVGEVTAGIINLGTEIVNFLDNVFQAAGKYIRKGTDNFEDMMELERILRERGVKPAISGFGFSADVFSQSQLQMARNIRDRIGKKPEKEDDELRKVREGFTKALGESGLDDKTKEEVAKKGDEQIKLLAKQGRSLEYISEYLKQLLGESKKQTPELEAQTKHGTPPIPIQPVTIGLEQALSLWASGLGKASFLRGPLGAAAAGSRAEYEQRAKEHIQAQLSVTYNPNLLATQGAAQAAMTGANMAAHAGGLTPGVANIQQSNVYQVTVEGNADTATAHQIPELLKASQDQANRNLVNNSATVWSK